MEFAIVAIICSTGLLPSLVQQAGLMMVPSKTMERQRGRLEKVSDIVVTSGAFYVSVYRLFYLFVVAVSAAVSSRSREAAPKQKSPNIAVTSWGHGVVGCSKKTPCAGVVTSRGINKLVKPSTHKQVAASKYASYRQEMEKNRDLSR